MCEDVWEGEGEGMCKGLCEVSWEGVQGASNMLFCESSHPCNLYLLPLETCLSHHFFAATFYPLTLGPFPEETLTSVECVLQYSTCSIVNTQTP